MSSRSETRATCAGRSGAGRSGAGRSGAERFCAGRSGADATRRTAGLVLAGTLLALLVACSSSDSPRGDRLTVTGSSTVAPLLVEIARRFEADHPGARVDVQTGGSSRGIRDARSGIAHLGMVSRPLDASESDLVGHPIAIDAVGLIVHADNPIESLTREEVRGVYRGRSTTGATSAGRRGRSSSCTRPRVEPPTKSSSNISSSRRPRFARTW